MIQDVAERLEAVLPIALTRAMTDAAERHIQSALKLIEADMRARVAEAALAIIDHTYSVDRMGADLRITVNLSGLKPTQK